MRQLATIRRIDDIQPIENADTIDVATIGGWNVVVKKGIHQIGDQIVYFEIDSWIPEAVAPFLGDNGTPVRTYEEVAGFRLKTKKLRGVVSQGLILPLSALAGMTVTVEGHEYLFENVSWCDDEDVTEILNVKKYEVQIAANLAGFARGNFPSFIRKTDQERIQNISRDICDYIDREMQWEVTEKLDGTSCTIYKNDALLAEDKDALGVCSRNLDLKETEGNVYWDIAKKYDVHAILLRDGRNLAIQGEIIGEGIQGNKYKMNERKFYVFDIFDIDTQQYMNASDRAGFCALRGLNHTPILKRLADLPSRAVRDLIPLADGRSTLYDTAREGLVYKCEQVPSVSFKIISNKWLMKHDE